MNAKALIFFFAFFIFIVGCDKNDYNSPESETIQKANIIGTWESLSEKYELFDARGKLIDSDIINYTAAEEKQTYVFKADKTGSLRSLEDGEWTTENFNYSVAGKILTILFKGGDEGMSFEFEMEFEYLIKNNKLYLIFEGESDEDGIERATLELIKK